MLSFSSQTRPLGHRPGVSIHGHRRICRGSGFKFRSFERVSETLEVSERLAALSEAWVAARFAHLLSLFTV
ncbi:hypothetical protein C8Q70DRAFT_1010347 [Cubamyces menziesii]|nr:hypothetical protein C8Q70DRAFT_1010347 [Cubamyces menziesii]